MRATLSILGMSQYRPDVFDGLNLPEVLDRDTVINTIIINNAELELLYPDADFLKLAIEVWSAGERNVWQHLWDACNAVYNPVENYDRMEDWTDSNTASGSSQNSSNTVNTGSKTAFNTNDLAVTDKDDNESVVNGSTSADSTGTHSGRVHGNIGVTTAQQMIEAELRLAGQLNVYNQIANSFKRRFCLMIY